MEPIAKVLQSLNRRSATTLGYVTPLGSPGCYVEWMPSRLIDPHEMAELSAQDSALLSNSCYGRILDHRWHEFETLETEHSGWCYLVQQIDLDTCDEIVDKVWWIDEEDLTFTGALRRRIPDASQIEILNPTGNQEIDDFATNVPLWWRAKYG